MLGSVESGNLYASMWMCLVTNVKQVKATLDGATKQVAKKAATEPGVDKTSCLNQLQDIGILTVVSLGEDAVHGEVNRRTGGVGCLSWPQLLGHVAWH